MPIDSESSGDLFTLFKGLARRPPLTKGDVEFYYKNKPMSELNLTMMRLIDEIYMESPHSGSRQIRDAIRLKGYRVNRKRIQRLMGIMLIEAIYPKRNLSKPNKNHETSPYLLRNVPITHANQVWSTDITYIRLKHGSVYLVAIIEWYSRKILSWEISTSLDRFFCMSVLERAMHLYGIENPRTNKAFSAPASYSSCSKYYYHYFGDTFHGINP